jgi:hypothetical protein
MADISNRAPELQARGRMIKHLRAHVQEKFVKFFTYSAQPVMLGVRTSPLSIAQNSQATDIFSASQPIQD